MSRSRLNDYDNPNWKNKNSVDTFDSYDTVLQNYIYVAALEKKQFFEKKYESI